MIFNMMNYGGGGSVEDAYAVVSVTYPAGSTCKCIKDDESYEMEAANTTGKAMFALPESGRWRLTCTDGTNTAIDYVTPVQNDVYEVTLAYSVSPEPTPTPTPKVTKIVATGYMVGAINATAVVGEWNGGDPVIGTTATYTVPKLGTYIVVYVPADKSGAKTYFVEVSKEGATYMVNLQTGAITVSENSGDEEETTTTTLVTVTFPTGSIAIFGDGYSDYANGTAATNTATFNVITGGTYIITFIGESGYKTQTFTARGESMPILFEEESSSDTRTFTFIFQPGTVEIIERVSGKKIRSFGGYGEPNMVTTTIPADSKTYDAKYTNAEDPTATKTIIITTKSSGGTFDFRQL